MRQLFTENGNFLNDSGMHLEAQYKTFGVLPGILHCLEFPGNNLKKKCHDIEC